MTLFLEAQKHSSTADIRRLLGTGEPVERFGGVILDTNRAFGKLSVQEQVPHFPLPHTETVSAFFRVQLLVLRKPQDLKGGRVKLKMGQDLANPAGWSHLSFTFSVCSVGSWKMSKVSLRCPSPTPACPSPVQCLCRKRHVTPRFPSFAMTKYPRQTM